MLLYITDTILKISPVIITIVIGKLSLSHDTNTTNKVTLKINRSVSYITK